MFKDDQGGFAGFSSASKTERTFVEVYSPKRPKDQILKITGGARHVVALTRGLDVLTWGISSQGQLGRIKSFQASDDPPSAKLCFTPEPVPGLKKLLKSPIADIGCGLYNTFVISESGDVAGWGLNNSGQLGVDEKVQDGDGDGDGDGDAPELDESVKDKHKGAPEVGVTKGGKGAEGLVDAVNETTDKNEEQQTNGGGPDDQKVPHLQVQQNDHQRENLIWAPVLIPQLKKVRERGREIIHSKLKTKI
jgi:hypothetical protein